MQTAEQKRRIAAIKTADAINAIEGAPISDFARALSNSWVRGELTDEQAQEALWLYHQQIAERVNGHACHSEL